MDNQNTDNKIQQNEAQQPANATAQPTAEAAYQLRRKTSAPPASPIGLQRPEQHAEGAQLSQHRLHAARHRGGNTLDPAGRKPQYCLHRTHRGCSAQDCRSMYPTI